MQHITAEAYMIKIYSKTGHHLPRLALGIINRREGNGFLAQYQDHMTECDIGSYNGAINVHCSNCSIVPLHPY